MILPNSSELFGTLSIISWLGAQLPQTIQNYQEKSVEGLALTFLFNWFMGDGCNLIGCILTHQLPFQTYLAVYFVFVDSVLLVQYFHYGGKKRKSRSVKSEFDVDEESGDSATSPLLGRDRRNSLMRSYTSISSVGQTRGRPERPDSRFNTVERIAANITTAAERMTDRGRDSSPKYAVGDVNEEVTGAMTSSMYSERSVGSVSLDGKGKTRQSRPKQKVVTFTPSLEQENSDRGRSFDRARASDHIVDSPLDERTKFATFSSSRSQSKRSKRSSTAATSIVFMGVWTLFGLRSLQSTGITPYPSSPLHAPHGKVLQPLPDTFNFNGSLLTTHTSLPLLPRPLLFISNPQKSTIGVFDHVNDGPTAQQLPEKEKAAMEGMIGRIFAWICTTFYLTCRMPQIWMNYMRKSCKGLSPFLFVFAFMGNTFYVLSIITSEKAHGPGATAFLMESLPYLVGSGGTLSFDIVILTQAFIYRGRKPRRVIVPRLDSTRSFSSLAAATNRSVSRSRTRERSLSVIAAVQNAGK